MAVIGEFEMLGLICKLFEYFKITALLYITLVETILILIESFGCMLLMTRFVLLLNYTLLHTLLFLPPPSWTTRLQRHFAYLKNKTSPPRGFQKKSAASVC